tara:strand:+ start:810 stop:1604 length:795 start_codon:yes stop_codon:yes gene_type:complete
MNDLIEKVQSLGIAVKENWLDHKDIEKIEKSIQKVKPIKGSECSIYAVNLKTLIKKIFKMHFNNIFKSLYFINLSKKLKLKETAEEILKSKTKLLRVDLFWSPQSQDPVIQWHVDNAYSGRKNIKIFNEPDKNAIKFIFYLTDVSSNNGCLSYIPYSHKIAYALKQGIHNKDIKYQTYWTLSDFRKAIFKQENFNYIKKKVDEKIINDFLNTSEKIINRKTDETLFDYEVKKGGAVVFDEAGVHKGSKTELNDRIVLRFFYRRI